MDQPENPGRVASDQKQLPLRVTLCRFQDKYLIKETRSLAETDYVAVSHVWGDAQTYDISYGQGGADEIIISPEKAQFLRFHFGGIIKDDWFWMDILCIDQNNPEARVAVTQHIPLIFRLAKKTLVVKDSTAIRRCCDAVTPILIDYIFSRRTSLASAHRVMSAVLDHYRQNRTHLPWVSDGVLNRLWPLQEILLSDKIEFTWCDPLPGREGSLVTRIKAVSDLMKDLEQLETLATSWVIFGNDNTEYDEISEAKEFISAYLDNTYVVRKPVNRSRNQTVLYTTTPGYTSTALG